MKTLTGVVLALSIVLLLPAASHAQPISDCGTVIQGVECILFDSDNFGVYIVGLLGSHGVGDRIHVTGTIDPLCETFCMQGDGCIDNPVITSCGEIPTLSEWGIIVFGALLLIGIGVMLRRRRLAAATN